MIDFLAVCFVIAVAALISVLLSLPAGVTISLSMIGGLFTVLWIIGPIVPDD